MSKRIFEDDWTWVRGVGSTSSLYTTTAQTRMKEYIIWCKETLGNETWDCYSFTGQFCFKNAEDATAFKLRFQL